MVEYGFQTKDTFIQIHFNASENKQKLRFCGPDKPNFYETFPCGKNHFLAAIWSIEIIRPYFFFWKILMESVNVERYLNLLKRKVLPALQRKTTNFSRSSVLYLVHTQLQECLTG